MQKKSMGSKNGIEGVRIMHEPHQIQFSSVKIYL
jgi:hypothetical protein